MTDGTAANAIRTALWRSQEGHSDSFAAALAWSARDALRAPDASVAHRAIVTDLVRRALLSTDPSPETLAFAAGLIEAEPTEPVADDSVFEGLTA